MSQNRCPVCHAVLILRHGTYEFDPPTNIPGGIMVVEKTQWEQCPHCGEQILPPELISRLDEICLVRILNQNNQLQDEITRLKDENKILPL